MRRLTHRFTWDLDKTYLQTDFDTVRGLLRAAFEPAVDKRAYPGARQLLQAVKRQRSHGLHILSGSPRQMRRKLEEKLGLDGIEWDAFELKPNLENLVRGRIRAVRDQVGYKLPALLRWRAASAPGVEETLMGDDAEADAFVYALYADLVAGRVRQNTLNEVLELAGSPDSVRHDVEKSLRGLLRQSVVRRILIHLDRRSDPAALRVYGTRVVPVTNYLQAALVLHADERVGDRAVLDVATELAGAAGFGRASLVRSMATMVEGGYLAPAAALAQTNLLESVTGPVPLAELRSRLKAHRWPPPPPVMLVPDYAELYRRTRGRIGVHR